MRPIGVRAHDYGKQPCDSLFATIASDGWESVQLAIKKAVLGAEHTADLTNPLLTNIRRKLDENHLTVSVLGAYVEPGLAEESRRRESVAEFLAQLSAAKALHAGCIATETTKRSLQPGVSQREAMLALERSLGDILTAAEPIGMIVAVEPVWYHTLATPEAVRSLLSVMGSQNLKVIFDPVNLLSPEEFDIQHSLWDRCFESFGSEIATVHLKGTAKRDGKLVSVPLTESAVDYFDLFQHFAKLSQPFSILREEACPETAQADYAFIAALSHG